MEQPSNLLNNWIQNWVDASQKFQEAIQQKRDFDQTVGLYDDWLKNQQKLINTFMGKPTEPEKPDNLFSQILEMQTTIGKSWLDNWDKMSKGWSPNYNRLDATARLQDTWQQIYTQWTRQLGRPFGTSVQSSAYSPMELFGQLLKTSSTYAKMQALWQPFLQDFQAPEKTFSYQTFLEGDAFREILNNLFEGLTPRQSDSFFEQMNDFTLSLLNSLKDSSGQLNERFERIAHLIPDSLTERWQGTSDATHEIYKRLQKGLAPFLKIVPPSKEKEMLHLMLDVQEHYLHYYTQSNQLKDLVAETAHEAAHKVLKQLAERFEAEGEPILFDDFFQKWLDITEADLIQLYHSDHFSQLQGKMLTISSLIKKKLDEQMEEMIAHLPLVPRSEVDEMAAIIHELRGKVRQLEKELHTLKEEKQTANTSVESQKKPASTPDKQKATATKASTSKTTTKATTTKKATTKTTKAKSGTKKVTKTAEKKV
ncbi:MAG: poly(R)-hydroxyalkanoic acid synthase subunit PhaE [Thermonemataceae bacterium]|mgnify:CR=1 FL=1